MMHWNIQRCTDFGWFTSFAVPWKPRNNQRRVSTEKLLWFQRVIYSKTARTLTGIMGEDSAFLHRTFKVYCRERKRPRGVYRRGSKIVSCILENRSVKCSRFTGIIRQRLLRVVIATIITPCSVNEVCLLKATIIFDRNINEWRFNDTRKSFGDFERSLRTG